MLTHSTIALAHSRLPEYLLKRAVRLPASTRTTVSLVGGPSICVPRCAPTRVATPTFTARAVPASGGGRSSSA
eukprot:4589020-Prymnesium_polylepis.1